MVWFCWLMNYSTQKPFFVFKFMVNVAESFQSLWMSGWRNGKSSQVLSAPSIQRKKKLWFLLLRIHIFRKFSTITSKIACKSWLSIILIQSISINVLNIRKLDAKSRKSFVILWQLSWSWKRFQTRDTMRRFRAFHLSNLSDKKEPMTAQTIAFEI